MPQIVTPSVIRDLNTSLTTIFQKQLQAEPTSPFFQAAVMETESTTKWVDYAWIVNLGAAMREWIGEREVMGGMELDKYLIQNRKFELTVEVKIEDIEDGTYAFRARMEAQDRADAYQRRKHDELVDLVHGAFGAIPQPGDEATWFKVGTALLGPDGVPFFAANHPRGKAIKRIRANGTETYIYEQEAEWSNITSAPFSKQTLKDARKYLRKQKDHYGRAARLRPNLLVVGPELEEAAVEAVSPQTILRVTTPEAGVEERLQIKNDLANAYTVMVVDEFGDSPAWMLLDTTRSTSKPFIFQNRVRPQFQRTGTVSANAAEGLVDPTVFNEDVIRFGVRARFGSGYGNPILGFGSLGDNSAIDGDALG